MAGIAANLTHGSNESSSFVGLMQGQVQKFWRGSGRLHYQVQCVIAGDVVLALHARNGFRMLVNSGCVSEHLRSCGETARRPVHDARGL